LFFPAYDFVSYAAGLTQIPYRVFVVITVVGALVTSTLYVWIGTTTTYESQWITIGYFLVGTAILLASLLAWLARRRKSKDADSNEWRSD
jgi:uncharacterized membrane protein YdjX (TVP38/TMEM64 family)